MSKINKVIAGLGVVAGLGVALAPVATFAADAGSDSLTVNVNSNCAIKTGTAAFTGVYSGSGTPGNTIDVTKTSGTNEVAFGCNENSKIEIKARTDGLAYGSTDTIAPADITASYTGANGVTIVTAYSGAYGALSSTATKVAEGTATSSGDLTFTVSGYKAALKNNQKPGTYTGTVEYTFDLVNE